MPEAAGHVREIMRVAGGAVMNVLAGEIIGVFAHVDGADEHRAGGFEARDHGGIACGRRAVAIPTIVFHGSSDKTVAPGNGQAIVQQQLAAHAAALGNQVVDALITAERCLDAMLPGVADEYKIGYTKAELEWCRKEEKNIWAFLVKEKYLYETESKKYLLFPEI